MEEEEGEKEQHTPDEEGEAGGGDEGADKPEGEEGGNKEEEKPIGEETGNKDGEDEGAEGEDGAEDVTASEYEEEDTLEPKGTDNEIQILYRRFNKALSEVEYEPGMEHFAEEFRFLFEALLDRHERTVKLQESVDRLQVEMLVMEAKEDAAAKISANDKDTINALRGEVEKSWRLVDTAHSREQNNVEVTESLRREITRINKELEAKQRLLSSHTDESSSSAQKGKDGGGRERERVLNEVMLLRERLQAAGLAQLEMEAKAMEMEEENADLRIRLETQEMVTSREILNSERVSNELHQIKVELEEKLSELKNMSYQAGVSAKTIQTLQESNNELKELADKLGKENEALVLRSNRLQAEAQSQIDQIAKLTKESRDFRNQSKVRDEELGRLKVDLARISHMEDVFKRKIQALTMQRDEAVKEKERLRFTVIPDLEREVDGLRRLAGTDRRAAEETRRERDLLEKNLLKARGLVNHQQENMRLQEQLKRNLEIEIDQFSAEATKQRSIIETMVRERERLIYEAAEMEMKVTEAQEDTRLKQITIAENRKAMMETEGRLRQQINLYEAVRADRNAFAKHLLDANDEISELRSKLKIQGHHVEQLKEDISTKEEQLLRSKVVLERSDKEKEGLRLELQLTRDALTAAQRKIAEMEKEEQRLLKIIQDDEDEARRTHVEMEQMMNERDILGTQLVRRNDELSLLYKKIQILQVTLGRGEEQYDQRLEDIRLLKLEVRRLRTERNLLARSAANAADVRNEVFHLERDLMQERLKVRALEEDMQNPVNVHRWRKLLGSDPTHLQLIQKMHVMQKRLLGQAAINIEREAQLQQAQRLYLSLRQLLARQPGPEAVENLRKTQRALRDRGNKMKTLIAELNMCEAQAEEYKRELDQARDELTTMKNKYFELKKRQRKMAPAGAAPRKPQEGVCGRPCLAFYGDRGHGTADGLPEVMVKEDGDGQGKGEDSPAGVFRPFVSKALPATSDGRRFLGGGFNMTQPAKGKR